MKLFVSACTLAIVAFAPLAGSAADKMASPKPAMMSGMKMTHQCRDAKGHFVKGKYMKCPAGTHKAM
ncbi:MAG: hypothetical protein IAI48_07905 [Candidatus Eremiobacteraeota bacterium]|nr:hypothetical protein [Candidatus Eremiobacteraeota bacterium]